MCGRGLPDTDILVNTSIKDEFIKQEVVCWFLLESPQHGHKVGEKNSPNFSGFSRAIIVLFQRLSYQKFWRFGSI